MKHSTPTTSLHLHPILVHPLTLHRRCILFIDSAPSLHFLSHRKCIRCISFWIFLWQKKSLTHRGAWRMEIERTGRQRKKMRKKKRKGERGIRTLGDCEATLVFKTNALNRSATSPWYSIDLLNNNRVVHINAFSGFLFGMLCTVYLFSTRKVQHLRCKCILNRTSVGPVF